MGRHFASRPIPICPALSNMGREAHVPSSSALAGAHARLQSLRNEREDGEKFLPARACIAREALGKALVDAPGPCLCGVALGCGGVGWLWLGGGGCFC